jgi:hypothetical protein
MYVELRKVKNMKTTTTTTTRITKETVTAILGTPYTVETMGGKKTYPAGTKAKAYTLTLAGLYVVEGHGIGHVIPLELWTKYIRTWEEVTTTPTEEGTLTTIKPMKEEVTGEWLAHWKAAKAAKEGAERRGRRAAVRGMIAARRAEIRRVTKGETAKELEALLKELETLK